MSQPEKYEPFVTLDQFLPNSQLMIQEYKCGLCKGVYCTPVIDKCGHIFCEGCIKKYISIHHFCPISYTPLSDNERLSQITVMAQITDKQTLKCKNAAKGCTWVGYFSEYKNHLQNVCKKVQINCPNEGCKEKFLREDLEKHLAICLFKLEECKNCHCKFLSSQMESHLNVCPKMKVTCPQKCGAMIIREDLTSHIENDCEKTLVNCPFSKYGCKDSPCVRKVSNELLVKNIGKHMKILLNLIEKLDEKVKGYENKQTLNEKDNSQHQETSSTGPNASDGKETNLKSNLLGLSNSLNKKETEGEKSENGTSKKTSEQKDFLNQKRTLEEEERNKIYEEKKPKKEKEFLNDQIEVFEIEDDEEEYWDKNTITESVVVNEKIVRCNTDSRTEHVYVFTSPNYDADIKGPKKIYSWSFKLLKGSMWIAFGLCDKEQVQSNKGKFLVAPKSGVRMHGSFLISNNGYSWNGNNSKENNVLTRVPTLKEGSIINLTYNTTTCELNFDLGGTLSKLTQVSPVCAGNTKLTPCILFLHSGDEVQFLNFSSK